MAWGRQPPPGSGPNPWWGDPDANRNPWQPPGHDKMFSGPDVDYGDPINRSFTTKKRHGWWGKEERYDMEGRKIG